VQIVGINLVSVRKNTHECGHLILGVRTVTKKDRKKRKKKRPAVDSLLILNPEAWSKHFA